MSHHELIQATTAGLNCSLGEFCIDPTRPVRTAVITHGHSDHARAGSHRYICSPQTAPILRHRLGKTINTTTLEPGETIDLRDTRVSLHPAGHLLGSTQVRVEHDHHVWVVTGDYKRHPDPTCAPFEVVPCDVLISECTFGLPIYRWPEPEHVFNDINQWWRDCQAQQRTAVLSVYALGKAQRILAAIDPTIGPVAVHGSIHPLNKLYRDLGISLPDWTKLDARNAAELKGRALVLAPPAARNTTWIRKLTPVSTAAASGWMTVRGRRRHDALDRGFVISDHADWPGLLQTIRDTGARRVGLTHGNTETLVRYLRESGVDAFAIATTRHHDEAAP
ncbi:ligase-associated DNA damage response exonuclease [Mucisphaera calidilacus]|uniref:Beta-lactamase superfamily domain protein n=1 Tax=Mucisphaera calidilacus TaxID=2527982 RepID=A0A518BXZ7_9BACT|nr:ligase-associated DNA damage response exonuclease [Mucisphaera calidilacus]QDU71859.1 Beta-lactamase superfamily domain protein [Mucisphaera calidilacus]